MGIGFTIDTPLKVAPLGIDSVISIVDDTIIEQMREHYIKLNQQPYLEISKKDPDYRERRITDYLNLINQLVIEKFQKIQNQAFEEGSEINNYFELLPKHSELSTQFYKMLEETDRSKKEFIQEHLRSEMKCGSIDVNIMAKIDTTTYDKAGNALPEIYNDAMSALRAFANTDLNASVVLSAGYNPRLYNYIETFNDFLPNGSGELKKKVILKVSDYRSAAIQGKILAKKGIWISEFRIESGLNCGGHTFATEGKLLGPILEEFKTERTQLQEELFTLCQEALKESGRFLFQKKPHLRITAQGGIGTSMEHDFLMNHYELDATGWGSPFLLVSEVTNVDDATRNQLAQARKEDYYVSTASPLGVPFNNFHNTSSQKLLKERIDKNRPGSPCHKKFLTFDGEFTEKDICTASRQYQHLKLKQLEESNLSAEEYEQKSKSILEKECLCEGLAVSAVLVHNEEKPKQITAVSVCPGPNLAYFSGKFSLKEMVQHIYGQNNLLNSLNRNHMFVNELEMYMDYLKKEINNCGGIFNKKQARYFKNFKISLFEGINYYKDLFSSFYSEAEELLLKHTNALKTYPEF